MAKYRLNYQLAGVYIAMATGVADVGGVGTVRYNFFFGPDSPEKAVERQQSAQMREAITIYLPLASEMVMAAPATEYPPSTVSRSGGTMAGTFSVAKDIIENTGIGNIKTRCEALTYLRAIHRLATENYVASNPAVPLPNLQTHLDAAQRETPVAPLCKIN